ncbi:MAG: hypothetical protein ACI8XO_002176 [Verrucomicrobiales bacterium]|jgi:hypothetical protein
MLRLISAILFTSICCVSAKDEKKAPGVRFDPIVKKMEGWTVHVEPALLEGEHAAEGAKALRMLGDHLNRIVLLMNKSQLAKLQTCEIWIERHHPTLSNMQYHPGVAWLKQNGHDLRLVKKVHITRAAALLDRSQLLKHPAVVLHELAHAYHDQILGFEEKQINQTWKEAMDEKLYDRVLLFNGRLVKHYATTNPKEYFAESTEAYFYRNDFYPFVRAELQIHDPRMHAQMVRVWGKLQ